MKEKILYAMLDAGVLIVFVGVAGFVGAWVGALFAIGADDHGKGVVIFMCLGAVIAVVVAICFLFDKNEKIEKLLDDVNKNGP